MVPDANIFFLGIVTKHFFSCRKNCSSSNSNKSTFLNSKIKKDLLQDKKKCAKKKNITARMENVLSHQEKNS